MNKSTLADLLTELRALQWLFDTPHRVVYVHRRAPINGGAPQAFIALQAKTMKKAPRTKDAAEIPDVRADDQSVAMEQFTTGLRRVLAAPKTAPKVLHKRNGDKT